MRFFHLSIDFFILSFNIFVHTQLDYLFMTYIQFNIIPLFEICSFYPLAFYYDRWYGFVSLILTIYF